MFDNNFIEVAAAGLSHEDHNFNRSHLQSILHLFEATVRLTPKQCINNLKPFMDTVQAIVKDSNSEEGDVIESWIRSIEGMIEHSEEQDQQEVCHFVGETIDTAYLISLLPELSNNGN